MSDTKHSDSTFTDESTTFTNENTVRRRAWIDRALAGVRGDQNSWEESAETGEATDRPRLYVVSPKRSA